MPPTRSRLVARFAPGAQDLAEREPRIGAALEKVGSGVDLDRLPGALLGDRQIAARSPNLRPEKRNVCLALDVLADS